MWAVETLGLNKVFAPTVGRQPGSWRRWLGGSARPLIKKASPKVAVVSLNLQIGQGERVAFIGPNGAGKSTTVKMLCGIMQPTSGLIRVCGLEPVAQQKELVFRIGAVFGQKSQLWERLSLAQCLKLLRAMYRLDGPGDVRRAADLVQMLQVGGFQDEPLARLSLGQRMRCELIAALVHKPGVLFLDEPTIGLDANAKELIRQYLREIAAIEKTTVLLTSHDTLDMESVCDRVVMISQGNLVIDESIADLRRRFIKKKYITLITREAQIEFTVPGCQVNSTDGHKTLLTVDLETIDVSRALAGLSKACEIRDLTVQDPPLEEVLRQIYTSHGA
jgi:ABC-2 type transport system ATP-binding protein